MAILHNKRAVSFTFLATTVLVLVGIIVFMVLARTGNSAQAVKQRSVVEFPHGYHTADFECLACHHDYNEDGENVIDEAVLFDVEADEFMSLNQPMAEDEALTEVSCASCHNEKASINAMDAFHGQCISCHEKQGARPLFCGECHR